MTTQKIFNIGQAQIFIKKGGCIVTNVDWSRRRLYIEFLVDKKFKEMMSKWQNKEFLKND